MKRKYPPKCRCMTVLLPDGTCRHGCAPLGKQPRRHRASGVKERAENFGQMRKLVDDAAARIGLPSAAWGTPDAVIKRRVQDDKTRSARYGATAP
jgi:hypothetical protein